MPVVTESFVVGALAASTLLLGAVIAFAWTVPRRVFGLVLAFGAGVLLSAVAYELVEESFTTASSAAAPAAGFALGVATFAIGSLLIDRAGGGDRKAHDGGAGDGVAKAIVLGTVLDGVPESAVLGMTIAQDDGLSAAMLVAVLISNLPEGLAATAGLRAAGHSRAYISGLWIAIALASGLASLAGYALLADAGGGAFVLAFAGGAILTMLADTMMPEAYADGGRLAGVVTAAGFALAFAISVAG